MTRGSAENTKVFYKGKDQTFVVILDDYADYLQWKKDESVPLAQVLSGWKILTTHKQGAQGIMDTASRSSLENEFGGTNDEEWIKKILRAGYPQTKTTNERTGDTNSANGPISAF